MICPTVLLFASIHQTVVLILVTSVFFTQALASARLCVQCTFPDNPRCIESPPPARSCKDGKNIHCMITKELTPDNTLIKYIRDCSTIKTVTKDCHLRHHDNITVCYDICNTDGCNEGGDATPFSIQSLVAGIVVALVFVT
ncbi:hypothetical protein ScPMuIL_003617 [Solemya velum]